jgi:hypothetical protein
MTARRDSSSEPTSGSFGGRLLLTAGILFALAATGTLILTDEQKWLKLGIVAALWAALAGAFVAARYRRQVADQEDVLAERHERYQLELEREIAARREYELEVVAEARRQADEEARDHIAALRQELFGLRQTLEGLLGGEFLVERYAVRAESTRMRSLSDDLELKRLPPATAVVPDAKTELIEPVGKPGKSAKRKVEPLPRRTDRPGGRTQAPRPGKPPVVDARPEPGQHPAELSDRWFVPDGIGTNQPPKPGVAQPNARKPGENQRAEVNGFGQGTSGGPSPVEPAARNAPPSPVAGPPGFGPGSAQSSGYGPSVGQTGFQPGSAQSSGYGSAVGQYGAPGFGPGSAQSSGFGQAVARNGAPGYGPTSPETSNFGQAVGRGGSPNPRPVGPAESSGYGPAVGRPQGTPGFGQGAGESSGFGQAVARNGAPGYGPTSPESSGYGSMVGPTAPPPRPAESSGYGPPVNRAEASGHHPAVGRQGAVGPNPQDSGYRPAVSRAEASGFGQPVNRPPAPDTGGRRRRAEGQPTWQESRNAQPPADAEPSGSHAAGRSVSELLASHGGARPPTPRRRRRKE